MARIGINGLGRIGKCTLRLLCNSLKQYGELVAVNVTSRDIETYIHLIKYDSVHGRFNAHVEKVDERSIAIDGQKIQLYNEKEPENIPWDALGVDVVFECTGKFNQKSAAAKHLGQTVRKVIVSAPVTDADVQIIYGVNEHVLTDKHDVISVGSCTTNCAANVIGAIDSKYPIESGFITTVHAYTNDQNHVDGRHKDLRRARACNLSMIPTSTGASKAICSLFPHLTGKLQAAAIRVPVPNVSVVDFTFTTNTQLHKDDVNAVLMAAAQTKKEVIEATWEPLVSTDFNHTTASAVFDLAETYTTGGKLSRVLAWYDNEWAFSHRMVDVLGRVSKFL